MQELRTNISGSALSRFLNEKSGNFAIWFALSAFPVLIATSMAIDFRDAQAHKSAIKNSLDAAVLAAVSDDKISKTDKQKLAESIFKTHYSGDANIKLDVKVDDGRVEMNASGSKAATLSRAVGMTGFKLDETSIAVMTRTNTICVMALAKRGKHKVRFIGQTEFDSPTCSVQSNSVDQEGILSTARRTPVAKSFCSSGGAKGDFNPAVRGECRIIEDPYETRAVPASGFCMPESVFEDSSTEQAGALDLQASILTNGHDPSASYPVDSRGWHKHPHCHTDAQLVGNSKPRCHGIYHPPNSHTHPPSLSRLESLGVSASETSRLISDYGLNNLNVVESTNYAGNDKVLFPGTYCGGLTVTGKNVTFMPGVYIIKDGSLTFKNRAQVQADEVSFVLKGTESVVTVESGSYVNIKAPRGGPMAGMALYQDKDGDNAVASGGGPRTLMTTTTSSPLTPGSTGDGPTAINLISSGGELNVTGTMYFPTQALDVLGDSVLGARAAATSFIAYQVTFADETKASVSVNHVAGKIPAMLPQSDDGARLIK